MRGIAFLSYSTYKIDAVLLKQVWSTNRCILLTFFSSLYMDRWMDQQAYLPIERHFYLSTFLGLPDDIHEEKPFLDFENNWLPTDGRTDRPTDRRTDRPSYRDARTHLIMQNQFLHFSFFSMFVK